MNIAVIGTGNVGGGLAGRWALSGHRIFLGARDTASFKGKHLLNHKNVTVHTIGEAAAQAEVILIAAAPQAVPGIVTSLGPVSGKIVIDAMNSVRTRPEGYENTFQALRALAPDGEIVKCFNSTGFENMKDPFYPGGAIDMFMAGDSTRAKEVAARLARDAGFAECHDFGGDSSVPLLEQLALCWINLAIVQGYGRDIAFKVVRR